MVDSRCGVNEDDGPAAGGVTAAAAGSEVARDAGSPLASGAKAELPEATGEMLTSTPMVRLATAEPVATLASGVTSMLAQPDLLTRRLTSQPE